MKTELALLLTHDKPVMMIDEVADLFGLSGRTMENRYYAGNCPIPLFKIGSKLAAHISDVAKYIDEQRADAMKLLQKGSQPA